MTPKYRVSSNNHLDAYVSCDNMPANMGYIVVGHFFGKHAEADAEKYAAECNAREPKLPPHNPNRALILEDGKYWQTIDFRLPQADEVILSTAGTVFTIQAHEAYMYTRERDFRPILQQVKRPQQ